MQTITFRAGSVGQATVESGKSASAARRKGRGIAAATGVALAASLFAASGAEAQNCGAAGNVNVLGLAGSISGVASMINASITATSTAFLLQSSSFIGSPPNPAPDQQGGGIWVRGVGGEVSVKSATTSNAVVTNAATGGVLFGPATIACSQKVNESFAGVQFGSDIAKLNVNGWNLHLGTTAGVLGSRGTLSGGAFAFFDPASGLTAGGGSFTSSTQVPFVGVYAAATKGGFFIDGLLRAEYYQSTLNAVGDNLFGQVIDAHGWSFSSSAGYNWAVPNSKWFIEPSGSVIISRTKVDPLAFTNAGTPGLDQLPGTLQLNEIKSDIGRLGLRVGETIEGDKVVWQPFAAVSVWHEFGSNPTANYTSAPGCCVFGPPFVSANLTGVGTTTTIGTFGQYSLGVSASVIGTGWLGFARVDYRDGPNLQGLSGTAGLRYQFTPDMAVASHMPVKAPVLKAPVMTAVNWTGFYVGGYGGAILGRADWGYVGGEVSPHVGGFDGGGNIGFDWQSGRWVLGAVAELEGTNTKGGTACNPGAAAFLSGMLLTTCNASIRSLGDVAARVGYTWDRALFYVKGGGAWTNERFTGSCNNVSAGITFLIFPCTNPANAPTTGFSASNNRGGWIIGEGTEFALTPHWSARAESNYISFGDRTVTATDGSALKVGMHVWETRVGLNYRFSSR